ncbi:hypothetical protein [Pseudopelagicola sp. nBUS_19]|uniref:hypothetical protein n=1 Tax=unclassified Pseudopelagicola TaxID=2649563 RepID=UPI003EBAD7C8
MFAVDGGTAIYEILFFAFTYHRGMKFSGREFSKADKLTTTCPVHGTLGLMTDIAASAAAA